MKYNAGDKVRIKSLDWYNKNKSKSHGTVACGGKYFDYNMREWCGKIMTILTAYQTCYIMEEDGAKYLWTDEMFEGLVEEETKPKFKVGDRVMARDMSGIWEITNVEDDILYTIKRENSTFTLTTYGSFLTLYEGISDKKEEMKSEDELLDEYEELTDRAFKGGYEKCKSDIELNGFQLPEGYIFKDDNGNEIWTNKIILEKVNTLKIQSDNMETETHRGYYTIEEETTNKSKKVAWFTFWDNDFADKVELDLSNRELIQEDGKWFVVKKKKEYPKTYEECSVINGCDNRIPLKIIGEFTKLINARNAYWRIAGQEMGLDKPWEPDYTNTGEKKFSIWVDFGEIKLEGPFTTTQMVLSFPTEEMRDAFYENFKEEIEICKELL